MTEKIVVCIMGQNCERTIGMCLESVKDADAIVYCDGGSTDNTIDIVNSFFDNQEKNGIKREPWKVAMSLISNPYDQEDKGMNGKQRNFYLDYLKHTFPNDWVLCLDADEVCEELGKIKKFIQTAIPAVYSIKMRHFIGDLGHEDSTVPEHYVLNRLFKISEAYQYPELEHPILIPKEKVGRTQCTTVWHLAYIPNLWEIKKRYENHLKKSNIHTPAYLQMWYRQHLFGAYPRKPINPIEIPGIILKEFGINPEEVYFATHSQIEAKHFIMMRQWIDHFKPNTILDLGAGIGLYGYAAESMDRDYIGIEISKWAVDHRICEKIYQGDIREKREYEGIDLILCIDILEHLEEEELEPTLDLIKNYGKKFIFSLPFEGDPNLTNDPTHKIFKSKEWWKEKLGRYFQIKDAPSNWLFNHQLLLGAKHE